MVKFIYCIVKRADLSDAEFRRFWKDVHAPHIRSIAATLRAKRYVQSYTIATPLNDAIATSRGLETPPYDGVTELWWDSIEEFTASVSTPEGQAAAQKYITDPDVGEANFVDFARSRAFLTEEHTVFDLTDEGAI